ncbi:MAG TPA: hypothetical protein ENO22_00365 [candidate division Zixibacteria bacterium]|nr:hypothetical protein [candidate division Zixibacteria bacterium]HEQ97780.1 hypothetical protein [candidate division Zixibacteria bacterium]
MLRKVSISIFLIGALVLAGCEGTVDGELDSEFAVNGLLLHNPNDNTSFAYAFILEDGEPIPALTSFLVTSNEDSTQLVPIGGGAYLTNEGMLNIAPDSSYVFWAGEDLGDFYFSKTLDIADTFSVVVTRPATRIYSGGTVSIEWDPPSAEFGYFVTIEPPSDAASPFWEFANSTNEFVIGAEAFTTSTGQRVTGIYKIYVVAYSETFYSDALIENDDRVFFPYPDTGFANNIDLVDVKGRLGSAIISFYDSVTVIAQP